MIDNDDDIKILSSIIEYRCDNILETRKLLEKCIDDLHHAKSKRSQDKICLDISIKMDYIEILLSKIIDDIMSVEIIELDKHSVQLPEISSCKLDDGTHYYQ